MPPRGRPGARAVLHQPNSASRPRARPRRHAPARWPNVEAIFPLDADDLLSPLTLATLWELLDEHQEIAWATPRLELMGAEQGTWYVPGGYLPYRQLFENQCGSSSLIRRAVFDAGIAYDETMRHGYEDWEFFLHATLKDFTGLQAGACGFRYRRKATSMVSGAQERAEAIRASIRARHPAAYAPRSLVRREHEEWPRFALVRAERPDVLLLAAVDLEPRWVNWSDYVQHVDEAGGGAWPTDELIAPITVLATEEAAEWLTERRLLAGALLRLQAELAAHEVVELRIGNRVALGLRTRTLHLRGAQGLAPDAVVELHGLPPAPALTDEKLAGLGTGRRTDLPPLPVPAHADRFARLHIDERETTLPWHGVAGGSSVMLVAPWLRRDGAHRGAVELLRAAQQLDPAIALHLALTEDTDLVDVPLELFETVSLGAPVAGADVLIHTGTPVPVPGALHVALDERAARHLDGLVDVYIAATETAARRLANLDAAPDKIALAPAATVLRPGDPEHARRLAADKNRHEGRPVVLTEGPFTPEALERADVVVLGGAADPTLALDAMAFGCLVIAVGATRLDDVVIHGETGLVLEADALPGAIARHTEHARERDGGVEHGPGDELGAGRACAAWTRWPPAHDRGARRCRHERRAVAASPATARAMDEAGAAVILIGGYDGSGNFGDIALLDAAVALVERLGALPVPVVESVHVDLHHALRPELGHILVYDPEAEPEGPLPDVAAVYLYGGGYLNSSWGGRQLAKARLALEAAPDAACVSSGWQVEPEWVAGLGAADRALLARFAPFGVRDPLSAEALAALGPAEATGDDAVAVLPEPSGVEEQERVNVHVAEHGWVTHDPTHRRCAG